MDNPGHSLHYLLLPPRSCANLRIRWHPYQLNQIRRNFCGARYVGANTSYQLHHCWLTAAASIQWGLLATSAFTLTVICRCGHMLNVQCQGVSAHCDNSVRFAVRCRLLHSRCWWSRWYTAYWTTATAYWLAYRLTWCASYSLYSTQQPVLSTAWRPATTSLMRSSVFTGCGSQSAYNTSWLFWRTKSCTEARQPTSVHSFASLICLVDDRFALLAPIVLWCHKSNCLLLAVGLSRLLLPNFGTVCLTASFPSTRCRPSGVNLNITCSRSPILTLSCDLCLFIYCDTLSGPSSGSAT